MQSKPSRWRSDPVEVATGRRLAADLGVSPVVGSILARRGFGDVDEARRFLAASIAAALFGLILNGGSVPGQSDTHIIQALIAIPGAAIGLAISYWYGMRLDRQHGIDHGQTRAGSH